ncbi:MAG: DUF554 domain-containing protein [Clostridium sp.]|uniref:DUF554 domain-containing protein n=1 Tax=Clostridium sp. TaxID=1506 RepID=UPI001EC8D3EA|nr:DUF554 domain-containing protein [Clostridium sp.]MBS5884687.1 DUF554 domain-containing protein [Clostridium sp.]MDU7148877.1 DUF554 domain-containing protein [Clostridium sp.]MDU7242528.1 DUF554 domain-containing protein [Clostridium sp.]
MIGTLINSLTIIIGSIIGIFVKGKINEKISNTIMNGLALCVIYIGISGALKGENTILMIISIALGGLIGELIDIDSKLENLGNKIEKMVNKNGSTVSIAEGFVTSTLLFCVGAMAIVGALESGLNNNYSTLLAKSILDGISSIIFSSTLGIGVILSSVSVLLYQGSITLAAGILSNMLNDVAITNITAVGSLLIIGLGFNILGISKIKVSNLLPAMLFAILLSFIKF